MSRNAKILVVEDARLIAKGIERSLQRLGYVVIGSVDNGEEAVVQAGVLQPDLILMDINLGGAMDGIEAARQIRRQFGTPVVFLTANSDEATLQRAKGSEPFGYLIKPYQDQDLQTSIEIGLSRHRLERRVLESEQWMAATLSGIGDGLLVVDQRGKVKLLSVAAERALGWLSSDAVGRPADEVCAFFQESDGAPMEHPVLEAIGSESADSSPRYARLKGRLESSFVAEFAVSTIWERSESISGAVLIFRDISDKRESHRRLLELNEQLRVSNAHLQQLNEQKNLFLGMAAHDLRNPLSVIQGYARFVRLHLPECASPQSIRCISNIERSARQMLELVEELLDVAALEAGKLNLKASPLDLGNLVETAIESNRYLAEDKQIGLNFHRGEEVLNVHADSTKLEQVVSNLISNAIKYSARSSQVEITAERAQEQILVSVSDQGAGIPPEEQGKLFQPFGLTSVRPTAGEQRTGLGLAIARRIVEEHGGSIGVESRVGSGSTFWFRLPRWDDGQRRTSR